MLTYLFVFLFGLLACAAGFCLGIMFNQGKQDRWSEFIIQHSRQWCNENCKILEKCQLTGEDSGEYCGKCPICEAQINIFEKRYKE